MTVLRHPRVAAKGICYGRRDMALAPSAPAEIAQAVALTPACAVVLSSPSARAQALAAALARAHGATLEIDPRLAELDFGSWEGLAWAKIPREESDPWAEDPINRAPPGGECFADLKARVLAAMSGREATVVTHAGPIRALRMHVFGEAFETAFAHEVPYATPLAFPII